MQAAEDVSTDIAQDAAEAASCGNMLNAAERGNLGAVRHFLRANPSSLEMKDGFGRTPLHWATINDHSAVLQHLIAAGAAVDAADRHGDTPLYSATIYGRSAVLQHLIAAGTAVDAADRHGKTLLHFAAENGHSAVLQHLIAAGAAVDAADRHGMTALHWAAVRGHDSTMQHLIAAGADVDATNLDGRTPLHFASNLKVSVSLLSGRSCQCTRLGDRFVLDLIEEAKRKLGLEISQLLDPFGRKLQPSLTLKEAKVLPSSTLTAIITAGEDGEEEKKQITKTAAVSPPQDPMVEKQYGAVTLRMRQSIYDAFHPGVEFLDEWSDLTNTTALLGAMLSDHRVLSPLIRLTPEHETFPEPIEVEVETCAGAECAWRSTETGWEKLETSCGHCHVILQMRHFCEVVVTGKCLVRAMGFIKDDDAAAKVALLHVGCDSCLSFLPDYCRDSEGLAGFSSCGPSALLGAYQHDQKITIQVPEAPSTEAKELKLRFHAFPLVSQKLTVPSQTRFCLEIDGEKFDFEHAPDLIPSPPAEVQPSAASSSDGSPDPVAVVQSPADSASCGSPDPVAAAPSRATRAISAPTAPAPAGTFRRRNLLNDRQSQRSSVSSPSQAEACLSAEPATVADASPGGRSRWRQSRGYQPSAGSNPQADPSTSASSSAPVPGLTLPVASPTASPGQNQGHLLLSGRFAADDTFTREEIMGYMRSVKDFLEDWGLPTYMVEASPGQSFAQMTRYGLGRAKGMVIFGTSEYGAYTGVGYETFRELENAYDRGLPLFPIRLCQEWPPKPRDPRDGGRGLWQNQLVFTNGLVYVEDINMRDAEGVARQLAQAVLSQGLF